MGNFPAKNNGKEKRNLSMLIFYLKFKLKHFKRSLDHSYYKEGQNHFAAPLPTADIKIKNEFSYYPLKKSKITYNKYVSNSSGAYHKAEEKKKKNKKNKRGRHYICRVGLSCFRK